MDIIKSKRPLQIEIKEFKKNINSLEKARNPEVTIGSVILQSSNINKPKLIPLLESNNVIVAVDETIGDYLNYTNSDRETLGLIATLERYLNIKPTNKHFTDHIAHDFDFLLFNS